MQRPAHLDHAGVTVVVIWVIAIAAIVASSIQLTAYRQATFSRECVERLHARWAARAGVEETIAAMARHTEEPFPDDAFAMIRETEYVARGATAMADWNIQRYIHGLEGPWDGPMDEHTRVNVNMPNIQIFLLLLDEMLLDVATAVGDWIDEDDEATELGAERDYYLSLDSPYEPRNGPLRTLAEFEMIAGVWPEHFRGEDWNLNNMLEPNENDGGRTLPYDEADDILDAGWSDVLTAYSSDVIATGTGLPKLQLRLTRPTELVDRMSEAGFEITEDQARAIINFGLDDGVEVDALYYQPLTGGSIEPLTTEQIDALVAETTVGSIYERRPGKMNINTVPAKLLRFILREQFEEDEAIADNILSLRQSPEGILSISELQDIPGMSDETFQNLVSMFGVSSTVFSINCTGRSTASGLEVEMNVIVDRSTVPIRILEYREQ